MKYHSTRNLSQKLTLREAMFAGSTDRAGLYLPDRLPYIPKAFFNNLAELTVPEIGYVVADTLFGEDFESRRLKEIIFDTLNFDIPLKRLEDNIYALEFFHGPTMAINDISARFMSRLLRHMLSLQPTKKPVKVLVSTSGDTGSAVARAFTDIPEANTYILFPRNSIGRIREAQLTSIGKNVHAIEVDGNYAKCRELVQKALNDPDLAKEFAVTSGNSINISRFLAQILYFFCAYAQLQKECRKDGTDPGRIVIGVPRGNLGNICAAVAAKQMGLPIDHIISAAHTGDTFTKYLTTADPAIAANTPINIERLLSLCHNHDEMRRVVSACTFSQDEINKAITRAHEELHYLMSSKTAMTWLAMKQQLKPGETGILFATNHPAKFRDQIATATGIEVALPKQLSKALLSPKHSVKIPATYSALKKYLLNH